MKFDLERKGYKKIEVDEYIFALKTEYESKLNDQKNRIFQLRADIAEKEKKIVQLQSKSDLISAAIVEAVAKAREIEKLTAKRYRDEMEQLRIFHEKWQAHYNKMLEKYPDDEGLKAQGKFSVAMDELICGGAERIGEIERQFESESARVSSKNGTTLAENAESASGFNFAEAWNPTDDLSKIMEDLGINPDEEE